MTSPSDSQLDARVRALNAAEDAALRVINQVADAAARAANQREDDQAAAGQATPSQRSTATPPPMNEDLHVHRAD